MKSFSFFEVAEEETDRVIKALSSVHVKGRKVTVEVATGEQSGSEQGKGKKRVGRDRKDSKDSGRRGRDERGSHGDAHGRKNDRRAEDKKKKKPSREERGYTEPRGRKFTKDDWKQFFEPQSSNKMKGEEPDFSEEGWARRFPKK